MVSARPDNNGFLQGFPSLMAAGCYTSATQECTKINGTNGFETII